MENFKLLVGKETARREAFDQALSAELYVQRSITRFVNSDT